MSYNRGKEIKIFESIDELSEFLGNLWSKKTDELEEDSHFSIALSGGSTPIKIFKYLSANFKQKIEWNKIIFFWGDERCVSPSDNDSNYKLANDYLLKNINVNEANIFRIKGENNPEEEAKHYSQLIAKHLPNKNRFPKFDFILLGLGEDGHTASIFPNRIELFSSSNFCEVAEHPITNQKRITITGNIINNATTVAIVAVGKSKATKVFEVLNETKSATNYPISKVNPINGKLIWMLDKESATKL